MIGLRADDDIDQARAALGLGPFGLSDAPGERDERPGAVIAPEAANVRIGLLRCLFADVAGIEDDEVGARAFRSRGHALRAQQLGHPLAVIDVHLAAEAFDSESLGSHCSAPIGEWWCKVKRSLCAIASRA